MKNAQDAATPGGVSGSLSTYTTSPVGYVTLDKDGYSRNQSGRAPNCWKWIVTRQRGTPSAYGPRTIARPRMWNAACRNAVK